MDFSPYLNKTKKIAHSAGNAYLKHRERIDTALIAHTLTATALNAAAGKIAISAITIKLAPLATAVAGAYYGPELCRRARNFLATSDFAVKPIALKPIKVCVRSTQPQIQPE